MTKEGYVTSMNSVGQSLSNFTRWVGEKVVGKDDFSGQQSDQNRDYAVIGAAAGAVAGGIIGTVSGFKTQKASTINEVWVNRNITHPEWNGYTHSATPDYSTECVERNDKGECTRSETNLDGWYHSYSPRVNERVVGTFTEPTFRHSKAWEPLMGGALGAIGGGLLGLGAGLGVAALQRALTSEKTEPSTPPKLSPEAEKALSARAGAAALGGALVGGALGVFVGRSAGAAELAARQTHTRVWNVPVYHTETLGHVPSSHYEHNWFGSTWASPSGGRGPSEANVPVNRDVPDYTRGGEPRLTGTQKVFNTNRYGPVFGGIAGGFIGAGVGLAAGLVIGVSDKLLLENEARKAAKNGTEKAA